MGVGTGRAKLLLLGEHAAVYGHPAVGMTLPWTLTVTHKPGRTWGLKTLGPHAGLVAQIIDRLNGLAVARGLKPPAAGQVSVVSDIVQEGGFGSSAALCAALVNAFFPGLAFHFKDELAWRAEFLFHGTPSGVDTALALREGWWELEPGQPGIEPPQPFALPDPGLSLVVGSVVRSADTKTLVASVAARRREPAVAQAIDTLGALARSAAKLLRGGSKTGLPELVLEARTQLRALDLETNDLTAAIDAGMACPGALAGKLSGAGGGGAFFVMFADEASARNAVPSIQAAVPENAWKAGPIPIVP